jgi:hypothetical protein
MAVRPHAVPALPHPAQRSSWQLAQQVWQESGVAWEPTTPELADVEPAFSVPSDPEPASVSAWLADPEPEDAEPVGFQPAAADAWSGYAERRAPDREGGEPARFERATADAWPSAAAPDDQGPQDLSPEGGFAPAAADAWSADHWAASAAPADTWFTGVGPADTRLADAGPADVGPVGEPAAEGVGPYFADSGVAPVQSEFPSRDYHSLQAGGAHRPGPAWREYPPGGFPGQAWPAGSARVPLGAPVALDPQAPDSVDVDEPFSAAGLDGAPSPGWVGGPPLSEPDELFRAWQGSVNEAAAAHGSWSAPRRRASASRRRRGLQAAAIGVPVAVIVTVGAGALMILTGKANEMLAVRADTGTPAPATGTAGARPTAVGLPPAFVSATLSGYPGQRGAVTVASMTAAAGVTLAAGTADGHPAIWRRASNGSWTLESAATLSAVTGSAGLASVTHGPAGWIAVGSTSDGRSTEPVVLASADGVRWQPVTSLAAEAGAGTEFLGAAAGRSGYVVVGRQMVRGRTFAVLWYSADLRSWTADNNDGLDGRLQASTANAIAATSGGFVAVGSHGAVQSMWTSSDGRDWRMDSVSPPAGAASATLRSVAASGTRVVAGGYAATRAGDIPVAVVSTDGGGQWRQIVLQAPHGLGMITALTGTPTGFTAAGVVGQSGSQHTVTWTSPDGLTWSRPAQTADSEITALTSAGTTVTGTEQGATSTLVQLPAP